MGIKMTRGIFALLRKLFNAKVGFDKCLISLNSCISLVVCFDVTQLKAKDEL